MLFGLILVIEVSVVSSEDNLGDDQRCHDVSIWGPVEYRDQDCLKCSTEFRQVKNENVSFPLKIK